MCPTLRAPGDELPWEDGWLEDGTRYKYIHTVGTVGRVEWRDRGGHPYTGIFAGASSGFVRLSLANEPSPPAPGTAPGMGLKFLRDGRDSANLVAMYSVDGQDSWNFFKNDFTTHIPTPGPLLQLIALKFSEATNFVQQVEFSKYSLMGGFKEGSLLTWLNESFAEKCSNFSLRSYKLYIRTSIRKWSYRHFQPGEGTSKRKRHYPPMPMMGSSKFIYTGWAV